MADDDEVSRRLAIVLLRERNEARAEVVRLREALTALEMALTEIADQAQVARDLDAFVAFVAAAVAAASDGEADK